MLVDPLSQLELIQRHLSWYPLMEAADIYKLLYQGAMGAEHLLSSPEDFILQLAMEFDHLQPDPSGRLLEPVRRDFSLLRLNLSTYKSHQGRLDALFPAVLETARTSTGDQAQLQAAWSEFVGYCEDGHISGFEQAELRRFSTFLESSGYPAVHHSQVYSLHYHPAYRLISASSARKSGLIYAG